MKRVVEVKICGLTNADDVKAALEAGVDFLGFVLYVRSPRGVTATRLKRILDKIDGGGKAVGVFVNESRDRVEKIARDCGLCAVQIQGDEKPTEFIDMPVPVWRAVRFRNGSFMPPPEKWRAERYVVDAAVPGLYGGTGVAADWHEAATLAAGYPVMLAGGLTPENVGEAVRIVKPLGVDVASGVETEPGEKSYTKMKQFIEAVKIIDSPSTSLRADRGRTENHEPRTQNREP